MVTITREAPSYNLGKDRSTTTDSTLIVLNYQGCRTATRYQTVTITVERTACLGGIIILP